MTGEVVDLRKHRADRLFERVTARAEHWWATSPMSEAVAELDVPQSVRDWIKQVAVQAWIEGALTSVTEYGDELRAKGVLPPLP